MRIASAEITNFRCHQRLRLDLDALTILLGANGAGKSSILDALGFFFEPKGFQAVDLNSRAAADAEVSVRVKFGDLSDADREAFHLTPDGNWVTLRRVAAGGIIRLLAPARRAPMFDNIRAITAAVPRRQAYMDYRAAHPELNLAAANSAPTANTGMREWERANPDQCVEGEDDADAVYEANAEAALGARFRYFRVAAVREAAQEARDAPRTLLNRLLITIAEQREAAGETAREIEARFQKEYEERVESAHRESVAELARRISGEMSGYVTGAVVELEPSIERVELPVPHIGMRAGEGEELTDIDRQGHGFQRTFLIAALQLLAQMGAASPGAPAIFLAVEEPELFQHPSRARHVGQVLARLADREDKRVQVIFSTHSPYLIDAGRFERIRLLRRASDGTRTVTAARPEDVAARLPSLTLTQIRLRLGQTMRVGFNEAFFASATLIAEGKSDVAAVLGAADRLRVDLDARGIVLLEDSKNVIPIRWAILDALGIPTYILFDADRRAIGEVPPDRVALNQELQRIAGVKDPEEFPDTGDRDRFACFRTKLEQYLEETRPGIGGRIGELAKDVGNTDAYRVAVSENEFPLLESLVRRLVALAQTPA